MDEKDRIESGIISNTVSIVFFSILLLFLNALFIYALVKSGDLIFSIFCIVIILGTCLFLVPLIKEFILDNKRSDLLLSRNEKYCSKGHVTGKRSVFKMLSVKSSIGHFYVSIDNTEYQVSKKAFDNISKGNYVYYEVKSPLYTEFELIDY